MNQTDSTPLITEQGRKVADHWSRLAVTYEGAVNSLEASGIAVEEIKAEDLHTIDMIHMGGLAATDELATLAGISEGDRVLDVGSGVGGPARRLADLYGAEVSGIELSETLYETAVKLTDLVGLSSRVQFQNGSALSLPFSDEEFDAVVMQHVAMQIAEKGTLFGELTRVVKPGGCLALHEIFAGDGELHFPLAWATEPSMSALEGLDACARRIEAAGFAVGDFIDHSDDGRRFHEKSIATYQAALANDEGAGGLSKQVTEARMAASVAMEKNLRTGSLRVGMLVCRKER